MLHLWKIYLPRWHQSMCKGRHSAKGVAPLGDHAYQNVDVKCVAPYFLVAERGMLPIVGWQQGKYYFRWRAVVSCRTSSKCGVAVTCLCSYEGMVSDPDVHGLFDGPGNSVHLPTHNGEIVHTDAMILVLLWS